MIYQVTKRFRSVAVVAALGLVLGSALTSFAAPARQTMREVRYGNYIIEAPIAWPVIDLAKNPSACVRFDLHAVYLGRANANQQCPAHAVGRTEAIWLQPLSVGGAPAGVRTLSHGQTAPSAWSTSADGVSYAVPSANVLVTATWLRDPSLVQRTLAAARIVTGAHPVSRTTAVASAPSTGKASPLPTYAGLGFDACSAPSSSAMNAWLASPYRGAGVYIGGVNSACSQPNLTTSWVRTVEAAGWKLIPTYVGLQAPSNSCGCAAINPGQAASEGKAAANDAVTQAQAIGIGAGSPIYDDMEGYSTGGSNTSAVLTFLAAWTTQLHAKSYVAGVYSSGGSGITDMVSRYGTSYVEPDDIWVADWNGQHTVSDPYVPAGDWANSQRLHQYAGGMNATYGGVTINIDGDDLDGAVAGGSSVSGLTITIADHPAATTTDSWAKFTYSASAPGGTAGLTYTCQVTPRPGPATPCTTWKVFRGMSSTQHTFTVTVTDNAGHSASASYTWTIS